MKEAMRHTGIGAFLPVGGVIPQHIFGKGLEIRGSGI
jgi:hypothetical protein